MNRKLKIAFVILWIALLVGSGLWYVFFAEKESEFYEKENRMLSALPTISFREFWSGDLSNEMEDWLLDRFWAREDALKLTNTAKDMISIANYNDSLAVMKGGQDVLTEDAPDEKELEQMVSELFEQSQTVSSEVADDENKTEGDNAEQLSKEDELQQPKHSPKPLADPEDFPLYPSLKSVSNGVEKTYITFSRNNVLAFTSVLNRVADLLPEDGSLVYTMVPQSYLANQYLATENKEFFMSEAESIVHAFSRDNVVAFSAADILDEHLKNGEYVYFRSDCHWTPEGAYLVYREMANAAGREPTAWEDFNIAVEEPFLGTYYRDNPTNYMLANPDSLSLIRPEFELEWRRITGKDEYMLIPFLDENAPSNDRFAVYLGGPGGPWTYAESDNGKEENCLVITDSYGLPFIPMVATNYKQTHYLDPRYYNYGVVGYTVAEMIEKYEIKDVYLVIGEMHSYNNNLIISQLANQLGD
ncbi:MAG: hypothetical protein E7420_01890 [Ruminococcaceae bacterium]|nr:hypothetical protein [Oscillospiraceae bacterium]